MTELACCPFCGRPAKLMHLGEDEEAGPWGVFCTGDDDPYGYHGHGIENYATEEEAVEAWNSWPKNGVDEIRRQMGYLSHERNNFEQLMGSRDHWREKAQALESEAMHREMEVDERYVELPVDADGVPIRVGDMLDGYGRIIEVVELWHGRTGWTICTMDGNAYHDPEAFAHYKPEPPERTVEDVLADLLDVAGKPGQELDAGDLEGFADEIREMLGVDDGDE